MTTSWASRLDDLLDRTVVGSFTNIGHAVRQVGWSDELPRLEGETVIVTGATSGLGRAAAERLARMGAGVRLVGRSESKLEIARKEIIAANGNDDLETYVADFSSMEQIRNLAATLLEREPRIDVLINNAGALITERRETAEGLESTLATNLLSHFLLTNLLIPRLEASAPARIINVCLPVACTPSASGCGTSRALAANTRGRLPMPGPNAVR